jgi:transcriptional regulator with XRE-family HTH domain
MEPEDCSLDVEQRSNISKNLSYLLKLNRLTEAKLAQELDIPVMTIRRLISGETSDPRVFTLKAIADYLNISIDSLIGQKDISAQEITNPSKPVFIPVLDWSDVNNFNSIDFSKWKNWLPITQKNKGMGSKAFALESRPSMYPPFQPGTLFVLDPELKPIDGDLVLVSLSESNELTLRELSIDPPDWKLRSITQSSTLLNFNQGLHQIVAVVALTLFYNRE